MGMKKTTSLKASFWKFLCMLLIGLIGAVAIPFSLILAGTSTGLITYADYSERCTKDLAPVIAATPDLADVQLPMGCKYLVLDKNYQVTETTLEGDDLDRAMEYAISGKINSNLNKQYLFVTRKNEYVVLQYYIGSQFTNEWLYEHLPSPEILLYIFIAINCIAVDGNENAIEKLLLFYEAYISKCCLRPFYDEYGNVYIVVDMELKGRIREALLKMICEFEIDEH